MYKANTKSLKMISNKIPILQCCSVVDQSYVSIWQRRNKFFLRKLCFARE